MTKWEDPIRAARNEALEDAAKLAAGDADSIEYPDDEDAYSVAYHNGQIAAGVRLAARIRAMKDET